MALQGIVKREGQTDQIGTQKEAATFLSSTRGSFVVGQALYMAIQELESNPEESRSISDIADMRYLMEALFPMYAEVQKAKSKFMAELQRDKAVN